MTELSAVLPVFFDGENLPCTLAVLCQQNGEGPDPITSALVSALTSPLQIQLTEVGWQPFRGRALTIPYTSMTSQQKGALLDLLDGGQHTWNAYEHALVIRSNGEPVRLSALDVLEALCCSVLSSKAYPDRRVRVGLCNILLQRIQASVPIDKGTQAALNERLFGNHTLSSTESAPPETPQTSGSLGPGNPMAIRL